MHVCRKEANEGLQRKSKAFVQHKKSKMPILYNWIDSPLMFLEECIEVSGKIKAANIRDYFKKRVDDLNDINHIPLLNNISPDNVKPNSLIRCRCMVQDQFDPEYYLGNYETLNKTTGQKKSRIGMFRDTSDLQAEEDILYNSEKNVTLERQSLYCVPVPGESMWVRDGYSSRSKAVEVDSASEEATGKRQREEETDIDTEMQVQSAMENGMQKRPCPPTAPEASSSNGISSGQQNVTFDQNFPLQEEEGSPYIVVIYDTDNVPKLNEVCEFIGILSCDPSLAKVTMDDPGAETSGFDFDEMMTEEERAVHCPPSSLVPRIHCILTRKLSHSNPLLPSDLDLAKEDTVIGNVLAERESIRESIVQSLAKIYYGDRIAAEYTLLNIISKVYGRLEPMALGKFSLNITKCPSAAEPSSLNIPNEISKFIQLVTTKSHFIPLTIENLNKRKFIPKKDYNANRLKSGMLQLSEGTHLVLDETVLEPGQLDTDGQQPVDDCAKDGGVQNITAIGNVIQWQKVEYDFQFHKCDMKTDITILILSEGRSILQCDCVLPLQKQSATIQSASSVVMAMDPEVINKIRIYLEIIRLMDFNLNDQMQEVIKGDYVEMREADRKTMNPEVFHLLLVMARLVALSYGKNELTPELWGKTKELELARRQRLS